MPRPFRSIAGTALALLLVLAPAGAQSSNEDMKRDIEALKQGQQEILKQLEEIKKLVAAPRPSAPSGPNVKDLVLTLGANPVKGPASAKVTLLEFTDYQCPFCGRHVRETWPQIAKEYLDAGKIRYAMLDMPLAMHPRAFDAAKAARCAGDQGKFWEMHDRLFANQRALDPLTGHAEAVGLKVPQFEECMKSEKHSDSIKADMSQGQKAGFSGTPSFVIALTDPSDPKKVKGVAAIVGAASYDRFKAELDTALAGN